MKVPRNDRENQKVSHRENNLEDFRFRGIYLHFEMRRKESDEKMQE